MDTEEDIRHISVCSLRKTKERGDIIGRILVVEFKDSDDSVFDEVMNVLKRYPGFEILHTDDELIVSVPGLEICPDQRKVYLGRREISLTAKEYDLFYLLAVNKGRVLTYGQIYQNVWGGESLGREKNAVKCHIRKLRGKLSDALPDASFSIRCIREIGYSLEVDSVKKI